MTRTHSKSEYKRLVTIGADGTVCRGTLHDCARALVEKVRNNG